MWALLLAHAARHALLAGVALLSACVAGAPLGALAALRAGLRPAIVGLAALGRTLPSIALLMLLFPILGVGVLPATLALALLALAPIVINVDLAIRGVAPAAIDAASGLGMSGTQAFLRVRVPLALPLALSGVRTAAVEVIASATLATFVGAGGLGDDIVRALQTGDPRLLFAASAGVAAMAFAAEFTLARIVARCEAVVA